ncbi:hypothetical protein [Pseudolactococcus raffinolactis]|nr:hypothetical protein [Lactococcus raffinolactis]
MVVIRGALKYDLKNKSHGGRPPYDLVLMLKILILQRFEVSVLVSI